MSRFDDLHPQLRRYFGPIPAGSVGEGAGVFAVAGLHRRALRPVFAVLARWRIAFPDVGADAPFTVRNVPDPDGSLRATRCVFIHGRRRVMEDRMSVVDGTLRDRLGRRGVWEMSCALAVEDGALLLRSRRHWLRVGRLRIRLPAVVSVTLEERAEDDGAQRVVVRVGMPVLGEVFGYEGRFRYTVAPDVRTAEGGAREAEAPPSQR